MRRNFQLLTVLFLYLLWPACRQAEEAQEDLPPPNIAWFMSEDNSPFLGVYGDTLAHTPALDRFGREGLIFDNAFSNAPVCAPSRSTLITGVLPVTMGSQHMRSEVKVRDYIRFFPNYLREAGYFNTLRLKRDYNIPKQDSTWAIDEWWMAPDAFKGRKEGQPFFMFYNTWMTHEGRIHDHSKKYDYFRNTFENLSPEAQDSLIATIHPISAEEAPVPPYLPDVPEVRKDIALYYELMQMLDIEFARFLDELEKTGELDNTIILYTSDHGGVMGRSKRFIFESGLRVPMMMWFPEKYRHLAPAPMGSRVEEVVTFLDIIPTILQLAGVEVPGHFQGESFLAGSIGKMDEYGFGFRGRMDESYDMVRTIRSKEYRYIRNFMPFRPGGQHIRYLWNAANVRAWEEAYRNGQTNAEQSAFWQPRPAEELYLIADDPHNVRNLAAGPAYRDILRKMRKDALNFCIEYKDSGFIPEGQLFGAFKETGKVYQDQVAEQPIERIIRAADYATRQPVPDSLRAFLESGNAALRFWGAAGAIQLGAEAAPLKDALLRLLDDESGDVSVMAAEALYKIGGQEAAMAAFSRLLDDENPYVVLRALNSLEAIGSLNAELREKVEKLPEKEIAEELQYIKWKSAFLLQ